MRLGELILVLRFEPDTFTSRHPPKYRTIPLPPSLSRITPVSFSSLQKQNRQQRSRARQGPRPSRTNAMFTFRSKKQKQNANGTQGVRPHPSLPELTVSQGMKWPAGLVDVSAISQQQHPNELGLLRGPESPTTVRSARAVKTSFSADKPPAFHRPLWDAQNVNEKKSHPIGAMFGAGQRPPPSAYDKKAARGARINPRRGKVAPTFNIMVRTIH